MTGSVDENKENGEEREIWTKEDLKPHESCEFPLPSNQEYLSYYVYQDEWRPTRPLRPIAAQFVGAGPASVALPPSIGDGLIDMTRPKSPAYKMGIRLKRGGATSAALGQGGPGPAQYDVSGTTNQGRLNSRAPRIGTANRFRDRDRLAHAQTPGPAAYSREEGDRNVFPHTPAFSMGKAQRGRMRVGYSPGPNAYNLPAVLGPGKTPLPRAPAYSIGKSKRKGLGANMSGPGPAAYELPPVAVQMNRAPGYFMGLKTPLPKTGSSSPGPGMYYNHLVKFNKYSTPRITFGIKHSPYKVLPGFAAEN